MKTYMKSPNSISLFGMRATILVAVLALVLCGTSIAVAGPVSEYYLTAGQWQRIHVVQGSNVNRTWGQVSGEEEYAIAVLATVRTLGIRHSDQGAEYTLDGTPTGTTYTQPVVGARFFDGTTDGTSNYAWDFDNGTAYRFDLNWANPVQLFTLGTGSGRMLGITYDPTNDSLWLSGWEGSVGNVVENRAMNGTLLSSFTLAHDQNVALALDPADGTLWLHDRNTLHSAVLVFEQYSKAGLLLNSQTYPSLSRENILGGEFRVPEPGTVLLLGLGGLALLRRRRGN